MRILNLLGQMQVLQLLHMNNPIQMVPHWICPSVVPTRIKRSTSCCYYIINFIIIDAKSEVIFYDASQAAFTVFFTLSFSIFNLVNL
jgi:hypothetical protein